MSYHILCLLAHFNFKFKFTLIAIRFFGHTNIGFFSSPLGIVQCILRSVCVFCIVSFVQFYFLYCIVLFRTRFVVVRFCFIFVVVIYIFVVSRKIIFCLFARYFFFLSSFEGSTHYKLVFLEGSSVFKYIICLA